MTDMCAAQTPAAMRQMQLQGLLTIGLAEVACLLVDLLCQLTRGCSHQADGSLPLLQLWLVHDVHNHGQHKGSCFAAAGFGDALHRQVTAHMTWL